MGERATLDRARAASGASEAPLRADRPSSTSETDEEGDEDDISADPLGIIDVDGSGQVPNVISYLPLSDAAPVARSGRRVARGGAGGQSAFAHMPSIVESSLGGAALRVTGDLPLNATAAPAAFLDDVDPGMWTGGRHGDSVAEAAVAGRPSRLRVAPDTAHTTAGRRGDATITVGPTPDRSRASGRAASSQARSSGSASNGNRRLSLTPGGVAPLVEGDASAQQHVPSVDSNAARTTARLQSVRRLRFVDPSGATYAPGSAVAGPPGSPAESGSRQLSVEGAAAAAGGPRSPDVMISSGSGMAVSTPAQGSPDPVVPPGMGVEDLGFHVMSLPRGGRVYSEEPRGPAPAGPETRSLVSAMSGDTEGVARWLRRPEPGACPLVPFQAEDGRWAMPFVVLRVVNTGYGLNGKTMRELFAPYSSGADDDRGRSGHSSEKRKKTKDGRKRRHGEGVATASRNAQATAAPTHAGLEPCDGASQASEADDPGTPKPEGQSEGDKNDDQGGQSFAARVRSTGLGLGIAARLAFSMGATIRLFDAEGEAMERITASAGVGPGCARAVVSEGFAEEDATAARDEEAENPVVTVFEFALPVCPPGRLPRSLDDIPDESSTPDAPSSPMAEEARRPELTHSASSSNGVAGGASRRGQLSSGGGSLPVGSRGSGRSLGGKPKRGSLDVEVVQQPILEAISSVPEDDEAGTASDADFGPRSPSVSAGSGASELPPIRQRRRKDRAAEGPLATSVVRGGSSQRHAAAAGLPDAVSAENGSQGAESPSTAGRRDRPKRSRAERAARRAKRDVERARKEEARAAGEATAGAGGGAATDAVLSPKSAVADAMVLPSTPKPPLPPASASHSRGRSGGSRGAGKPAPAASSASSSSWRKAGAPRPKRLPPMRVLLVDDDTSVRDITARMLRRLGCSVDVLTDGVYVEPFLKKAGALGAAFGGPGFSMMAGTRSLSPTSSQGNVKGDASGAPAARPGSAARRVSGEPAGDGAVASAESRVEAAREAAKDAGARGRGYDVIFLDIVMPRLSGDVVCRRLVGHFGLRTPIFACSGNALPADLERYRSCGFSGVAAKPFSLAALKSKLFEVAAANEARASGMALAAGKRVTPDLAALMGAGPAQSSLAESELFAGAVTHILHPSGP